MDYPIRTVCVVGLGYIGLPTAATLASRGVEVIGVDINPHVVDAVNAGQPLFSEPDLDMLLRAATTLGKLRATSRPEPADVFVIAVPILRASLPPFLASPSSAGATAAFSVAPSIAPRGCLPPAPSTPTAPSRTRSSSSRMRKKSAYWSRYWVISHVA